MPGSVFAGMLEKNASKAASPPADAPMPTMGNPVSGACGVVSCFVVMDNLSELKTAQINS